MPAYEHLNAKQLRMFIPAHELMGFAPSDDRSESEYSEAYGLLERKRSHNTQSWSNIDGDAPEPLIKSVAREGVREPVTVTDQDKNGESTIWNGHHRIVAAYDTDPNMEVPIRNI